MPDNEKRFEPMIFNYETTARTDFKPEKFNPVVKSSYKEKLRRRAAYKPIKDIRTLIEWQGPRLPFDLLWGPPKEILRTDPRVVQPPCAELKDLGRKEAQRTRPRLVMTPSVSMDDIDDDVVRELITNDVYQSSSHIAMKEAVGLSEKNTVRAPFFGFNSPANPVCLERVKPPRVPLEWRRESVSWDNQQLRTYTDAERAFWLRHGSLYKDCKSCKETTQVAKVRKLSQKRPQK